MTVIDNEKINKLIQKLFDAASKKEFVTEIKEIVEVIKELFLLRCVNNIMSDNNYSSNEAQFVLKSTKKNNSD